MVTIGQAPQDSLDSEFETALATAKLTVETARFDPGILRMFRSGKYATPLYLTASEDPWRIPFIMETSRREIGGYSGKPSDSLNAIARLAGFGTRRTLVGNPIAYAETAAAKPRALDDILNRLARGGFIAGKIPAVGRIPTETQKAAALILNVVLRVRSLRNLALGDIGDSAWAFRTLAKAAADENDPEGAAAELSIYSRFKPNYMAAAGHDLVLACQQARTILSAVPPTARYSYRLRTVWGVVQLSGGSDDRHADGDSFLVIDTGGNDLYVDCPRTSSIANWCSIVLDTSGNDKYLSSADLAGTPVAKWPGRKSGGNMPGPGGAILGCSILVDTKGDDLYRTHRPGIGSGRLGVAVVLDESGNDVYDAYQDSEGFGMFGCGILEDDGGDDLYRGFTQVQGCGQTGGAGLLADRSGNDRFVADDEVIDFPSPQSAQHNVSMAQGAGNGRRADYLDGESLAGGVGILYDAAGNDSYSAAVFGQGVGYWMGVGALWDEEGTDAYGGLWYVQGAAAHFAIGYLEDGTGNDAYVASMNMAQGAGHDFSVGFLLDRMGDDAYKAPNLSLGAGNANGIGIFADLSGSDRYDSSGITLGRAADAPANSLRARALCLGAFLDLGGGSDIYPGGVAGARNRSATANWTSKGRPPSESQVGVFYDR